MTDPFGTRSEITAEEYRHWVDTPYDAPVTRCIAPGRVSMPKLRENAFRDSVVALARYRGWKVMFTWDSRHSPKGWPDLFCVRNGVALAAELKIPPNKPTQEQLDWIKELALCGIDTYVWFYPEDWDVIEEVLA